MALSPRDKLKDLLEKTETESADSASLRLPADTLRVNVEGVGLLPTHISTDTATGLISVARPAHFGKGEKTLHDPAVRDTWELTPEQVTLGGNTWQTELATALNHLGSQLGLPQTARLTAELHSMLVYGKGQFFAPHQDSEKHDDMVATLVVSLPSDHSGGELIIDDGGTPMQYSASDNELVLVAFYADRHHEVLPVQTGHRVTLTFNVLIDADPVEAPAELVEGASALLREYFSSSTVSRFGNELGVPHRLAFLLDHEYSQHGLRPDRLKGSDAQRVATLVAAADDAGFEYALALAEIEETWDVHPAMDFDYEDFEDDEFEDFDDIGGDLNELIDGSTVLTWWADTQAHGTIHLPLDGDDEVCAVTPTASLQPYDSDFEGYVGNYGNTEDRWYRRAALLMWPKDHAFTIRAQASPSWALTTIQHSLEAGQFDVARNQTTSLLSAGYRPGASVMPTALKVAAGIDEPKLARQLVEPFAVEMLTAEDAESLAQLSRMYPPSLLNELFAAWDRGYHTMWNYRHQWVSDTLEPLSFALRNAGAPNFAGRLVTWMREWLAASIQQSIAVTHETRRIQRLTELGPATAAILSAAEGHQGSNIVGELKSLGDSVLPLLVATLRAHPSTNTPSFAILASLTKDQLTDQLAKPKRASDDWSINWASPGGEDLDRLERFLTAAGEQTLEWPLAKPRRQHIHIAIDQAGLPVSHTTRRKGSPHVLVLKKTTELFTRDAERRDQAQQDLTWISQTFR